MTQAAIPTPGSRPVTREKQLMGRVQRAFYIMLHIEPDGLRLSMLFQFVTALAIGLQFLLLPDDRFAAAFYQPINDLLPIVIWGWSWVLFATAIFFTASVGNKPAVFATILAYLSLFYFFWGSLFAFASLEAHGTFIGAVLLYGYSGWMFAISQTVIKSQSRINGPRSAEFEDG